MGNKNKNYYEQIDQSIDFLAAQIEYKDLTPFESYYTSVGELIGKGHNYQIQMRIVRMDSRLAIEENGFQKEEITKFHE